MSNTLATHFLSSRLGELASRLTLPAFSSREDCRGILLVQLGGERDELLEGLMQTYGASASADAGNVPVLGFHTVMATPDDLERTQAEASTDDGFGLEELRGWLRGGPCFPVPIAKRDSAFSDRIAIGRAVNKDIALRSASISKLHGWFEWNAQGRLVIVDAGSKNGTKVQGVALEPRKPYPVPFGARLRLGRLLTTVCPGDVFWRFVHGG